MVRTLALEVGRKMAQAEVRKLAREEDRMLVQVEVHTMGREVGHTPLLEVRTHVPGVHTLELVVRTQGWVRNHAPDSFRILHLHSHRS